VLRLDVSPHRRAVLAHSYEPQKLFVRIRLGVPRREEGAGNSVAIALCVDTSGSMRTKLPDGTSKLERAIEAISSIGSLVGSGRNTALTLVHFDNTANVLMPIKELRDCSEGEIAGYASQLRKYSGGTRLALALALVREELARSSASVKKVIILTDGETTDESECHAHAKHFARAGVALHCIGLGVEYNEDFLAQLADESNGFLYHLSESEDSLAGLRQAIWDALLRAERELVTSTRLRLDLDPQVKVVSLRRVYPMVQTVHFNTAGFGRLGNVGSEDEVSLIAELSLPRRAPGSMRVGSVSVTYDLPAAALHDEMVLETLDVDFTDDPAKARVLDEDVVFFVRQARMSAFADQAVSQARSGDIAEAEQSMKALTQLSLKVGNGPIARIAASAARELRDQRKLMPETVKAIKVGSKTKTLMSPPTKNL
jgi:Ca-activated chloride channel family protein